MSDRFEVSCDCGYRAALDSRARAEYGLRRHSCGKHVDLAARRARGEATRAAVDKTPKPCSHKQAAHRHGAHVCYVTDECRCVACTAANTAYERTRFRQHLYGRWNGLIDAQPAREHVRALMASGMGLKRIAKAAGVSVSTVGKLIYGAPDRGTAPSTRLRPDTVAALLAVEFECAYVPAIGTRRRLEALTALGWSRSALARRLGTTCLQIAARDLVFRTTAVHVAALYDQLSMTLPPERTKYEKISAARSRRMAREKGWLPPLAWDDELLDDPEAQPGSGVKVDAIDEAVVERLVSGERVKSTKAEKAAAIVHLMAAGVSQAEIERRTGINVNRYLRDEGVAA